MDILDRIRLASYAKVNLFLNITGVRDDGYHELDMVNAKISLHDDIICSLTNAPEIELVCSESTVPADETNTAYKAAERFILQTKVTPGARVHIRKRVPHGAGLGGGSSNAAATLIALNQLAKYPLSMPELSKIAEGIGADVPFFLEQGCCYVAGVGERVMGLVAAKRIDRMGVVICSPAEGVATHGAYGLWDKSGKIEQKSPKPLMQALVNGDWDTIPKLLYNAFEPVIFDAYPVVAKAYKDFKKISPTKPLLSGSGSNLFSIHPTLDEAEPIALAMQKAGYDAHAYELIL
ncbi:MAG: 4-(cytidine 5'-diphospho)-2-C-methyl-D-erythritol kinase [Candidatus Hinthialibacter antarcticus]|nr:4-(cytidine 5'-diphospho)-2-C-methyl-D-erythritol kinase [Candidatus Hinthialibacter antarcticus]